MLGSKDNIYRVIITASLGTLLEWYDFAVFASLAPILAILFFPHENHSMSIIKTYAVFAIGFFLRPIGAIVISHFGDTRSRKKVLVISMAAISLATTSIGLLPTYTHIGISAPLLLLFLRVLQGFSVGGETTGCVTFVLEKCDQSKRGFIGALMWSAMCCGILLGSLMSTLVLHWCSNSQLYSWGWRIPFLLSIFTGIAGVYLRLHIKESALFLAYINSSVKIRTPILETILNHRRQLIKICGFFALSATVTYTGFIFMPTYANLLNISFTKASTVSTIAYAMVTLLIPLAGYFSDKLGRKPFLISSAVGLLIFSYPLYQYFTLYPSLQSLIIVQSVLVLFAIFYQSTLNAVSQELSALKIRYTLTALGYNISNAVFGGSTPFIITYVLHSTHYNAFPGIYLTIMAGIALLTILSVKETAKVSLE